MDWPFVRETKISRRIRELAEPVCAACGVDLYLVETQESSGRPRVTVMIDALDGVSIDDCTKVSRQLSAVLDVADPIPGGYTLEVSSPGVDRRLRNLDDAAALIDRKIKVTVKEPIEGRRHFSGLLKQVVNQSLVMEVDGRLVELPAADIRRAHLVYDFENNYR